MIKWNQTRVYGQELTVLEGKENLASRVKIEIFEKVVIIENEIIPYKSTEKIKNFQHIMKIMSWNISIFIWNKTDRD